MRICDAETLLERTSAQFRFRREGLRIAGFVIRWDGVVHGYENLCRHLPLPLDYADGRFFTPDRDYLLCQSHGALYEPATGLCAQGPCKGASLKRLAVFEADGAIWLEIAEGMEEEG
jgi:nitrite reductase/ring-hydroxylating ferredoxin subunit